MANFSLANNQHVEVAVSLDEAGLVLDAGSLAASLSDPNSATATISGDQTSIEVRANGTNVNDNVLTVTGTVNGAPANPCTFAFDIVAPTPTIVLTPGAPVNN